MFKSPLLRLTLGSLFGVVAILCIFNYVNVFSIQDTNNYLQRNLLQTEKLTNRQILMRKQQELLEKETILQIERETLVDREKKILERENKLLAEVKNLEELEQARYEEEETYLNSIKDTLSQFTNQIKSGRLPISAGEESYTQPASTLKVPQPFPKKQKNTSSRFCIISAYSGDLYDPMGVLSDVGKEKYAWLHGYDFFSDPTLFNTSMSWGQRSAIRLILFRKYLPNYEWVYWSDSDVYIVNPEKKLEILVDSTHDVVVSKDWGGAQTNPGSMLLKNSPGGWELLGVWEEYIAKPETHHDDLIAFEKMVHEREDMNAKVRWVKQQELNAYPGIGMRDKSYDDLLKPENRHDLHKPGDFVVHVVNCLRDGGSKDPICCAGLAAQYYRDFELAWRKASGVQLYMTE